MSTTTSQTIKAAVLAKVETITKIEAIYETDAPTADGYPFATVVLDSQIGEFLDTASNLLSLTFKIRCFYDRSSDSPSGIKLAEEAVMRVLDDLANAFHVDYTLGGTANGGVEVTNTAMGYAEIQTGPARVADMSVTCKAIVSVVE